MSCCHLSFISSNRDEVNNVKSMILKICNKQFSRLATNANTVETILHGSVGFLTARSGGHLVSLQCYVSPYDIFEEGAGTQLNLTDNGECIEGCSVRVEVIRLHSGLAMPVETPFQGEKVYTMYFAGLFICFCQV